MSHVDEGTLHAYLDGELAPVERERVDAHLKGCPTCQARLADERAIIERASRLLGMATPPERAMPPLHQLRQPRLAWRLRRPLAWAATLILAVGLGWYARGFEGRPLADIAAFDSQPAALATSERAPAARPAARSSVDRLEQKDEASRDREEVADRRLVPAEPAAQAPNNALATRQTASATIEERDSARRDSAKLDDVGTLGRNAPAAVSGGAGISIRGSRPPAASAAPPAAPEPRAKAAAVGEAATVTTGSNIYVDGAPVQRRAPVIMSSQWPIIARQPARDVLGVDPVVIPGFAVRAYRRNPVGREIVVEQVTDAGTPISLIERRLDGSKQEQYADSPADNAPRAMAKAVNERLARYVGPLRIEIDGPLTPDSLSSLLELAR